MTAQTTTQRTAKHRLAVKERMARYEAALRNIEIPTWATGSYEDVVIGMQRIAHEALQGSASTQKPLDPTQRG